MTFINEHKILGADDETTAEVTENKELLVKGLCGDEKMNIIINLLMKIEHHLSVGSGDEFKHIEI